MRMRKRKTSFTVTELILAIIVLLGVGGWIANIYKLSSTGLEVGQWAMLEVLRVIGIFIPPLGSVMGFI